MYCVDVPLHSASGLFMFTLPPKWGTTRKQKLIKKDELDAKTLWIMVLLSSGYWWSNSGHFGTWCKLWNTSTICHYPFLTHIAYNSAMLLKELNTFRWINYYFQLVKFFIHHFAVPGSFLLLQISSIVLANEYGVNKNISWSLSFWASSLFWSCFCRGE